MFDQWKKQEIWARRSKNFLVQVSHTVVPAEPMEGPNRWCVYAYIYPDHPHFKNFSGSDMWQGAASIMPGHSYPSLLRNHCDEAGKKLSVQVGFDYNHLHDELFRLMETPEEANVVFSDAERLRDWLEKCDA